MKRNVGGIDRIVRAVLAVTLLAVMLRARRGGKRGLSTLAGLAATEFGYNAVAQYCPMNDALGVDTTSPRPRESVEPSPESRTYLGPLREVVSSFM